MRYITWQIVTTFQAFKLNREGEGEGEGIGFGRSVGVIELLLPKAFDYILFITRRLLFKFIYIGTVRPSHHPPPPLCPAFPSSLNGVRMPRYRYFVLAPINKATATANNN